MTYHVFLQKITLTNALRLSNCVPVKVGAATVPAGVPPLTASLDPLMEWLWFPMAEPVNVWAPTVLLEPDSVGTPAGHAIVPVAVTVCVWVARALPVNVCAVTVRLGAVALHAVVEPVPAAIFVAAQFPLVALVEFVPAGVPPVVAPLVTCEPV